MSGLGRWAWALALLTLLSSSACRRPVEEPAVETEAAPVAPTQRSQLVWREWVPPGVDAETRLPMVIALHGLGSSPESFERLFSGCSLPVRVILVQAPSRYGRGFSWFSPRARTVPPPQLAAEMAHAADLLAELVEELPRLRPTREEPIVTGFSQGGMLSFTLATRHPQLFRRAVPLAGWLPEPSWPAEGRAPGQVQIRALHGDADEVLPLEPTRIGVDALQTRGWDVDLLVYPEVGHTMSQPMRRQLYELIECR